MGYTVNRLVTRPAKLCIETFEKCARLLNPSILLAADRLGQEQVILSADAAETVVWTFERYSTLMSIQKS